MPGLYLHIPYCKQACHYCNFHFSTTLHNRDSMIDAIVEEMKLRRADLPDQPLRSIYLGGGTPSLLSGAELERIFRQIHELFQVDDEAEVTLEANPDDLNQDKIKQLWASPINRLSIGIQSFSETDLRFMNRAHNAIEARACIEYAQDAGFENLSIDLIYGAPTTSDEQWARNIEIALDYDIPHLSCYALTVEPRTALAHFIQKGKVKDVDEEQTARQFEYLIAALRSEGYEHYEISNFAKPGWRAKHNSSYWLGKPYLGIGPAAHSFDGERTRRWNVANNARYMSGMELWSNDPEQIPPDLIEFEVLTDDQRYNEYVMTSLRTSWGLDLDYLQNIGEQYPDHFLQNAQAYLDAGHLSRKGNTFRLTEDGKLLADRIAMEVFV
ncbi:radical SAM family heme chaperone HemW [Flavilitoribacter nigricans]|uniref:Heme chaperone HemW n=1 Tax=Flavilitoribacter nigricans (strain ATCC 23147 / DSM 23189 / NBRC 102662 / NCIMB 1420 / SS-2) TaxID=1122177 RepID=A0A2D0MZW7_FLAN2|nr:radical SAM family heme chaperone HemW [Flavilitoribacter nigricans]PHN01720.1 coproporphyrinogen III oxidase [Flavilitoribacter nigricans DSM 23189 = NBRC 102662]